MRTLGSLTAVYRYPVKSLRAQSLPLALLEPHGIAGDRARALYVVAGHARAGKTYRGKEHNLLHTTPSESRAAELAAGRGVAVDVRDANGGHAFDAAPVSLILDTWVNEVSAHVGEPLDVLRWRPNLVVHATGDPVRETDLVGARLELGGAVLRVRSTIGRCVTTTYDVRTGDRNDAVLGYVARERDNVMGVYCDVEVAGTVRPGDALFLPAR